MKAKDLFERINLGPTEAPPAPSPTKPVAPPEPAAPPQPVRPQKYPNPFIRPGTPGEEPGPMPRPKAALESKAKKAFGLLKEKVKPVSAAKKLIREMGLD